jgi:hypothetical protein
LAKNGSNNFRPPWRQQSDGGNEPKQNERQASLDIGGAGIRTQLQLATNNNKDCRPSGAGKDRKMLIARGRFCSMEAREIQPPLCIATVIPGWCVSTRPQMRHCASGNFEIPGSMLRIAPE